jgi:hypothetical protein
MRLVDALSVPSSLDGLVVACGFEVERTDMPLAQEVERKPAAGWPD